MNLKHVYVLVKRLRKEAIGEPKWIEKKSSTNIGIIRRQSSPS